MEKELISWWGIENPNYLIIVIAKWFLEWYIEYKRKRFFVILARR
ncbi:hypothetical protein WKT05_05040 [Peptoniphilus sp. HCN-40583]